MKILLDFQNPVRTENFFYLVVYSHIGPIFIYYCAERFNFDVYEEILFSKEIRRHLKE